MTLPYFCFLKCGHAALAHYHGSAQVFCEHSCPADLVCTLDVNFHNEIPISIRHILKTNVSEDSSIVDQDVYSSESFDGCVDNCFSIFDTVVVCNGLSTLGLDLIDDRICGLQRSC